MEKETFRLSLLESKEISTKQAALWQVTPRTASTRLKQLIEAGLVSKIATSTKDPLGVFVLSSAMFYRESE